MDESLLEDKAPAIARMSCVRGLTVKPSFLGGFYRVKICSNELNPRKRPCSSRLRWERNLREPIWFIAQQPGTALRYLGWGLSFRTKGIWSRSGLRKTKLEVPRSPGLGLRSPLSPAIRLGNHRFRGAPTHPRCWMNRALFLQKRGTGWSRKSGRSFRGWALQRVISFNSQRMIVGSLLFGTKPSAPSVP